jgi:hypothetical protein
MAGFAPQTLVLGESLAQLPGSQFTKTERQIQKPELPSYLDRVHEQMESWSKRALTM